MKTVKLNLPLTQAEIKSLKSGDEVLLTGVIYTARDAAHKRLCELLKENKPLPFNIENATIYYVGATPKKENQVIGSAGPTSSYRMDPYMAPLLDAGLKITIGKGSRSENVKDLLAEHNALYLTAIGGAGVVINRTIKKCELIAYPDLDSEAIYKLEVGDFPAFVTYDTYKNDLYERNKEK